MGGSVVHESERKAWHTHNLCCCGKCYACDHGLVRCLWCHGADIDLFTPCDKRLASVGVPTPDGPPQGEVG